MSVICLLLFFVLPLRADTYSTFQRTRYYSANRHFCVEVTPRRRATLYHITSRHRQRVWTRTLENLPSQVLVTNSGQRIVLFDRYYGNGGDPAQPVVSWLDVRGQPLTIYRLGELVDLAQVVHTISQAHWATGVAFTSAEDFLVISTLQAKRDRRTCAQVQSPSEAEECSTSVPYQQLKFAVDTGSLVKRTNIRP